MESQLYYQRPEEGDLMYSTSYYKATYHLAERYRERMSEHVRDYSAKNLLNATDEELERRANYMLLFSIHGRPGETYNTEVRYYFNWDIVVDNLRKTIITMYIDDNRPQLPVRLFGDRKLRKIIYDLWFRPNSKYRRDLMGS